MRDLLIRGAETVLTMSDEIGELRHADIAISGGVITAIGPDLPQIGEIMTARGCVVTPGLVNTHHHLYQSLTRAVPAGADAPLFDWLRALYPIWGRYTPDTVFAAAQIGLAELALSGCTLCADHHYIYPGAVRLDDTIEAAQELGLRLHATRGAMSIGESAGGLPPDALVEPEPQILKDAERVIDAFHDPAPEAMLQIAIAPCSPFSVSRELMRDAAVLARDKAVMLHTHLAENAEDVAYSLEKFGCRPGDYAESLGWVGRDVWHAHCVKLDPGELDLFARSGTGIAHCPCSNCRLSSGIAPVPAMLEAGIPVGLGVDGSASNDGANLLDEARQAMLLQRVSGQAMSARAALRLATRGGAEVLGRGRELGQIAPGFRADLAIWDVSGIESAGSWDPAALVLAGPRQVRDLLIEGREIISGGQFTRFDLRAALRDGRRELERLMA